MIGRNWLYPDFPAEDDYFLSDFIQRALPEEDIRSDETDQAEDFLSFFIDHADSSSLTPPSDEDRISYGDVEILQSKFFSSFSEFDHGKGVHLQYAHLYAKRHLDLLHPRRRGRCAFKRKNGTLPQI